MGDWEVGINFRIYGLWCCFFCGLKGAFREVKGKGESERMGKLERSGVEGGRGKGKGSLVEIGADVEHLAGSGRG